MTRLTFTRALIRTHQRFIRSLDRPLTQRRHCHVHAHRHPSYRVVRARLRCHAPLLVCHHRHPTRRMAALLAVSRPRHVSHQSSEITRLHCRRMALVVVALRIVFQIVFLIFPRRYAHGNRHRYVRMRPQPPIVHSTTRHRLTHRHPPQLVSHLPMTLIVLGEKPLQSEVLLIYAIVARLRKSERLVVHLV